jgi:hypothetical protein
MAPAGVYPRTAERRDDDRRRPGAVDTAGSEEGRAPGGTVRGEGVVDRASMPQNAAEIAVGVAGDVWTWATVGVDSQGWWEDGVPHWGHGRSEEAGVAEMGTRHSSTRMVEGSVEVVVGEGGVRDAVGAIWGWV